MCELAKLSRRERQIMEIIYSRCQATATEVLARLTDPPTRTAVRTFLRILEAKGHLKHIKRGKEFVYSPVHQRGRAGKSALLRVVQTFFDGSLEKAVAAHLANPDSKIESDELQRLSAVIKEARDREPKV